MRRAAAANARSLYNGVSFTKNMETNVRFALKAFPETRRIVFVHDQTSSGLDTAEDAGALAARFPKTKFEFLTNMTMADLTARIRRLPPDVVLVPLPFNVDASGKFFAGDSGMRMIAEASPVPVIGLWGVRTAGRNPWR